MNVEVCINCDDLEKMQHSVQAAYDGGASTIELCRDMLHDGLTPTSDFIRAARNIFKRPGIMVMIRPRPGGFVYTPEELAEMQRQIIYAAQAGADGVVFGVLDDSQNVDAAALKDLVRSAKKSGLLTTFHRAFDATPDPYDTLGILMDHGVDRLLTSGTPWGTNGTAIEGIAQLEKIVAKADQRIEIVVGGGVTPRNARHIVEYLPHKKYLSVHAYSSVLKNGVSDADKIKALVDAVSGLV